MWREPLGEKRKNENESATRAGAILVAIAMALALVGCGTEEDAGVRIAPHISPMSFGDIYSRPSGTDPDPYSNTYVPFEWTLLIQARGTDPVEIEEICIVGDDHNGEPGDNAFSFEGPDRYEIPPQREAAIRLTYDHGSRNTDLSGDGEPDPDQAALVIQSNAVDYPTLVVPICGRIISTSRDPETIECTSPITAPPEGEADRDLCRREE